MFGISILPYIFLYNVPNLSSEEIMQKIMELKFNFEIPNMPKNPQIYSASNIFHKIFENNPNRGY